jgi:peptidoglycan hydrolase-like protein with peptidoglycan-binding domain
MTVYLLGSRGPEVKQIQQRLTDLGFYGGGPDGVFGGGTDSAVRKFQLSQDMTVDGKVGQDTWSALFNGADVPSPEVTTQPLDHQCLALTGGFETNRRLRIVLPDCRATSTTKESALERCSGISARAPCNPSLRK